MFAEKNSKAAERRRGNPGFPATATAIVRCFRSLFLAVILLFPDRHGNAQPYRPQAKNIVPLWQFSARSWRLVL
ncbi:MAG TPA: hypothetical protein VF924_11290, partial [Stellaceae bacterium]